MGDFFFSFLKELNSATNKKMIALAIVLGLISGFLPTFTAINYIIFLFVLIFRIPLGLYTASFAIFSLFSYLLDPLFNKIGYFILTHFESFWTFLYNIPLLRWSGYNNTLVMGSFVFGIFFGIILYQILIKSIDNYRKNIFPKIKNIKFLSWIVPSEEKKGIIRISGIIASIVVIGGVSLIIVLFLDPFIKFILAFTLSKTFHKKVYIQEVNTKIFTPSLEIKNMAIDNFLIKNAYVKLNMKNLLWRKYDFEKIIFDAKTNSSIFDIIKQKSTSSTSTLKLPKIKLPDPNEILNSPKIESLKAVKKLQKDYSDLEKFYKSQNLNEFKNKIKMIKNEIEALKNLKISSPDDLIVAKEKFSEIQKEIEKLNNEIDTKLNKLKEYKSLIIQDIKNVKIALKKDYENIESQYLLLKSGNFIKLSEIYLKPQISKYVDIAYNTFKKIKPYLTKEKKEITKIPRKGIYIKYEDKIKYPDFVIRYARGNLKTSIAIYKIVLKNISDNQHLLGKRATLLAIGDSKFYKANLTASYYDYFKFAAYAKNIKVKKIELEDLTLYHPIIDVNVEGKFLENLYMVSKIEFNKVNLKYTKNDNIANVLNRILKNINNFEIEVYIEDDSFKISSNLDKIISKAFVKIYQKEIEKQKRKAIALLNNKINSELSKYNLSKIDLQINDLENSKNYLKKLIESAKKELIKKEKNNIQNKILKGIKLF